MTGEFETTKVFTVWIETTPGPGYKFRFSFIPTTEDVITAVRMSDIGTDQDRRDLIEMLQSLGFQKVEPFATAAQRHEYQFAGTKVGKSSVETWDVYRPGRLPTLHDTGRLRPSTRYLRRGHGYRIPATCRVSLRPRRFAAHQRWSRRVVRARSILGLWQLAGAALRNLALLDIDFSDGPLG